jgi:hypothetical protein
MWKETLVKEFDYCETQANDLRPSFEMSFVMSKSMGKLMVKLMAMEVNNPAIQENLALALADSKEIPFKKFLTLIIQ